MSIKKLQVDVDPQTALAMKAALDAVRELRLKHDSRALALILLDQAVVIYGHLKVLGHVSEASIAELFESGLQRIRAAAKTPEVSLATQNADGSATVLESSGRPS